MEATATGTAPLAGPPKIIVPITARGEIGCLAQAMRIETSRAADIIEWRADLTYPDLPAELYSDDLLRLRMQATSLAHQTGMDILTTWRSKGQGGEGHLNPESYAQLLTSQADLCAYLDVEYALPASVRSPLLESLRARTAQIVVSYHDFKSQPAKRSIERQLHLLAETGADIVKVAYTPTNPAQVAELLQAGAQVAAQGVQVIAIAMGALGQVSRLAAGQFGLFATFASIGGYSSAPGQIDAGTMRRVWEMLSWG